MKIIVNHCQKKKIAIIQDTNLLITDVQSALDLIATVQYETDCKNVVLPQEAITEKFFSLKTGLAGEILQKFVTYHIKVVIVGDFSSYASKSLHDFIYESNHGRHIAFLPTQEDACNWLCSVAD